MTTTTATRRSKRHAARHPDEAFLREIEQALGRDLERLYADILGKAEVRSVFHHYDEKNPEYCYITREKTQRGKTTAVSISFEECFSRCGDPDSPALENWVFQGREIELSVTLPLPAHDEGHENDILELLALVGAVARGQDPESHPAVDYPHVTPAPRAPFLWRPRRWPPQIPREDHEITNEWIGHGHAYLSLRSSLSTSSGRPCTPYEVADDLRDRFESFRTFVDAIHGRVLGMGRRRTPSREDVTGWCGEAAVFLRFFPALEWVGGFSSRDFIDVETKREIEVKSSARRIPDAAFFSVEELFHGATIADRYDVVRAAVPEDIVTIVLEVLLAKKAKKRVAPARVRGSGEMVPMDLVLARLADEYSLRDEDVEPLRSTLERLLDVPLDVVTSPFVNGMKSLWVALREGLLVTGKVQVRVRP